MRRRWLYGGGLAQRDEVRGFIERRDWPPWEVTVPKKKNVPIFYADGGRPGSNHEQPPRLRDVDGEVEEMEYRDRGGGTRWVRAARASLNKHLFFVASPILRASTAERLRRYAFSALGEAIMDQPTESTVCCLVIRSKQVL